MIMCLSTIYSINYVEWIEMVEMYIVTKIWRKIILPDKHNEY